MVSYWCAACLTSVSSQLPHLKLFGIMETCFKYRTVCEVQINSQGVRTGDFLVITCDCVVSAGRRLILPDKIYCRSHKCAMKCDTQAKTDLVVHENIYTFLRNIMETGNIVSSSRNFLKSVRAQQCPKKWCRLENTSSMKRTTVFC